MDDGFFRQIDDDGPTLHVVATDHTRGPWDRRAQHAGPPSALLAHAIDRHHPADGRQTSRITCEIRRPVPVGELRVRTEVLRAGRKVEQLGATMTDPDGAVVMTASVWRIRTANIDLGLLPPATPLAPPDTLTSASGFFKAVEHTGYLEAMEVRFVDGHWAQPGPAIAWMRSRVDLVAGRPITPIERVLVAADSGNGISSAFNGVFVNVDLTVHLSRPPAGDWVALDAATVLTNHGIGYAHSTLHDIDGPIGRAAQSLLFDRN